MWLALRWVYRGLRPNRTKLRYGLAFSDRDICYATTTFTWKMFFMLFFRMRRQFLGQLVRLRWSLSQKMSEQIETIPAIRCTACGALACTAIGDHAIHYDGTVVCVTNCGQACCAKQSCAISIAKENTRNESSTYFF